MLTHFILRAIYYNAMQCLVQHVKNFACLLISAEKFDTFCYFLPDGVQQQARRQLEEVVKMRQAGFTTATTKTKPPRGSQSQQHIKHRAQTQIPIPFGATQGRSEEREHEIKRKV